MLVEDGELVGDPSREIRMVTLNFLNGEFSDSDLIGGDGYPLPAFGEDVIELTENLQTAVENAIISFDATRAGKNASGFFLQTPSIVNLDDVEVFAFAFSNFSAGQDFDANADLNGDRLVNLDDLGALAAQFEATVG